MIQPLPDIIPATVLGLTIERVGEGNRSRNCCIRRAKEKELYINFDYIVALYPPATRTLCALTIPTRS